MRKEFPRKGICSVQHCTKELIGGCRICNTCYDHAMEKCGPWCAAPFTEKTPPECIGCGEKNYVAHNVAICAACKRVCEKQAAESVTSVRLTNEQWGYLSRAAAYGAKQFMSSPDWREEAFADVEYARRALDEIARCVHESGET